EIEQMFNALISLIINNLTKQISELFQLLIRITNRALADIGKNLRINYNHKAV
ncbi:hypothetical protein M2132_002295, partial [Dysgonomonas sp. PH5-45]|nr:hypothetical protein [Dysgonomonas sp. PH5-45]MDH6388855.1 hypothetical protein [Dysgonomonas sp. PH5-37]